PIGAAPHRLAPARPALPPRPPQRAPSESLMLLDHAPGTDTRQAWPGLYDGEYRQGTGASFEVENPSTGKCFATVDGASAEQISTVIGKARTAFDGGGWSSLPVQQRAEKLRAMLGWIQANADRFTDL